LAVVTGNPVWDAIGTLAIGVLLVVVAVFISIEVKAMLIGQSVDPQLLVRMREFLDKRPEIAEVFNLLTLQLGNDILVSIKARMREEQSALVMIEHINTVERDLKRQFPGVRFSFFEPDVRRAGASSLPDQ